MAFWGEVEGDHRGFESRMPQVLLDKAEVHAGFEQIRGGRMPERMDGNLAFGKTGALFGLTEGALDPGPTHGRDSRRAVLLIPPGGGKEPGAVVVGCPGGPQ